MPLFLLSDPVSVLKGVGPARSAALADLGVTTLKELLEYAPFRYEKVEMAATLANLPIGHLVSVRATVLSKVQLKSQRFRSFIKATIGDESGQLEVMWFNAPYVLTQLRERSEWYFLGKVGEWQGKPSLTNPLLRLTDPGLGPLLPIYHESEALTSQTIKLLIEQALKLEYQLDKAVEERAAVQGLVPSPIAWKHLHQPLTPDEVKQAKTRLAFDEMYELLSQVLQRKAEYAVSPAAVKVSVPELAIQQFTVRLPYQPTDSQTAALRAIVHDLEQKGPMHRLVQGEVGSGKTTVAAFALWLAALSGKPAVLVCPTKILATQHAARVGELLAGTGVHVELVTGESSYEPEGKGNKILIGTHALFHLKNLKPSLVVIDEEHRFGVAQREHFFRLKRKPHFLSMTATPIPRTVALTALADREVSFLEPHRTADMVKTWVVPEAKRRSSYDWITRTLRETGGQAFVVCPFIEESGLESLSTVKSATAEFERLKAVFPHLKLRLLHGRLAVKQKDAIFAQLMAKKIDMLVTTPVVEVGVDIPDANIMIIEGGERFGLAQLHQLRGRVGRRGQAAYCLVFETASQGVSKRLTYFANTYDGNSLAEYDLRHRGSGQLLGVKQHGFGELKFAEWSDSELIERVRGTLPSSPL
jgi:ATP-dependent DNA helicase RecG